MKIKKIAFFLPSLEGGGAEKMILKIANNFSKNGFYVDLLLVNNKGPYKNSISKKLKVIDFKKMRVIFSFFSFIKYVNKSNPDVIISSMTHLNLFTLISKIFFKKNIKIIISERVIFDDYKFIKIKKIDYLIKFFAKYFYKNADHFVAVSDGVKKSLILNTNADEKKISVIYNPSYLKLTKNKLLRIKTPKLISTLKPNKILLSIGRLSKQKNFKDLILAFLILKNKINCKLIILGEGEDRKKLEILIDQLNLKQDVFLIGFKINIVPWLVNSDLFVLSSIYEGFANVIVEAMSLGVQVVSNDCPSGPNEILENGKWGVLTQVGDVQGLSLAMEKSLQKKNKINVKKRARFFNETYVINNFLKIFKSL